MNREKLIAAGIAYDEGVARFAGKPQIYEKYLAKLFAGDAMDTLLRQLDARDMDGAFRTAHDLKGNTGNLSVNGLYRAICELVEVLRSRQADAADYMPAALRAKALYDTARAAVNEREGA